MAELIEKIIPAGSRVILDFFPYAPPIDLTRYVVVNNSGLPVTPALRTKSLQESKAQYAVLSSLSYDRFFEPARASYHKQLRLFYRNFFSRYEEIAEVSDIPNKSAFHNPTIKIFKLY